MLAGSGQGPHDPDRESRLTRLEDEYRLMRADLSATRSDVSYIGGRLEALPTTRQMVGTVLAGNIGLTGVLLTAIELFGHP